MKNSFANPDYTEASIYAKTVLRMSNLKQHFIDLSNHKKKVEDKIEAYNQRIEEIKNKLLVDVVELTDKEKLALNGEKNELERNITGLRRNLLETEDEMVQTQSQLQSLLPVL